MSIITIYHNPACGTSRNVLGLIRNSGEEPIIIEYLKTPPDRDTLKALIAAMGVPVRSVLREKGTPYAELGLGDPKWDDEQLIDFMLQHLILINRPIVVHPAGHAPVPALGNRARPVATAAARRVQQGRRRAGREHGGASCLSPISTCLTSTPRCSSGRTWNV